MQDRFLQNANIRCSGNLCFRKKNSLPSLSSLFDFSCNVVYFLKRQYRLLSGFVSDKLKRLKHSPKSEATMKENAASFVVEDKGLSEEARARIGRIRFFARQAMETMQIRETEYEALRLAMIAWNVCPHPVALLHKSTGQTYWNAAGMRLMGMTASLLSEAFQPGQDRFTDLKGVAIPEEEWPMMRALEGEIVEKKRVIWHKEKTVKTLLLSAYPVYEGSKMLGALLMFTESEPEHERPEKTNDISSLLT